MNYKKLSLTLAGAMGKTLANVHWENTSLAMTNESYFRALLKDTAIDFIGYHCEDLHDEAYRYITNYLDSIINPAIDLITENCKAFDASKYFDALKGFDAILAK